MTLKAISLHQPWAHFMAMGLKKIETRSRSTNHLGPLGIHAAMRPLDDVGRALIARVNDFLIPTDVRLIRETDLAFGALLAIVDLYAVCPAELVCHNPHILEPELGDYTRGRSAWLSRNCKPLAKRFPCRGKQGFFYVDLPDDPL